MTKTSEKNHLTTALVTPLDYKYLKILLLLKQQTMAAASWLHIFQSSSKCFHTNKKDVIHTWSNHQSPFSTIKIRIKISTHLLIWKIWIPKETQPTRLTSYPNCSRSNQVFNQNEIKKELIKITWFWQLIRRNEFWLKIMLKI